MTAVDAAPMAKKKKPEPKKDSHQSGFMVRLPEEYKPLLQRLKDDTDRPIAVMVRRAVDAFLKENGVEPPKS